MQARLRLGADAVKEVFEQSQKMWNKEANHPTWCGLSLLGVDGGIWRTPDNSLTLFDRGFYSPSLLNRWHGAGKNRHRLQPMRKGTQYEIVRSLGRYDKLIKLKTTTQARKKFADLPDNIEVRLVTKSIKGKEVSILTSLTDPMRFPKADIVDLYSDR